MSVADCRRAAKRILLRYGKASLTKEARDKMDLIKKGSKKK